MVAAYNQTDKFVYDDDELELLDVVPVAAAEPVMIVTADTLQFHLPGQHNQKNHGGGAHAGHGPGGHELLDMNKHEIVHAPGKISAYKNPGQSDAEALPMTKQHLGPNAQHLDAWVPDAAKIAHVLPADLKAPELNAHLLNAGVSEAQINTMSLKQKKQAIQFMKGYQTYDGQKTGQKAKISAVGVTTPQKIKQTLPTNPSPNPPTTGPVPMGNYSVVNGVKTWNAPAGFQNGTITPAMSQHSQDWKMSLTQPERASMASYTGGGYGNINASLKSAGGNTKAIASRSTKGNIKNIDAALAKTSLPEDRILYRGTKIKKGEGVVGATVGYDGYSSTSTSHDTAKHFIKKHSNQYAQGASEPAFLRIKAQKGTKAGYVNGWSSVSSESEVLLPRGTRFLVTGALQRSNGVWDLEVEIVPGSGV